MQEPLLGSHNQWLAKTTSLVRLCVSVQTLSALWRHIWRHNANDISSDHTENSMANVSMKCYDCLRTRYIQAHNFRIRRKLWVRLQYPALGSQPAGRRQCTTVIFRVVNLTLCGTGSSVGIATELRAGRSGIEARWGRDFPPVQTGPGGHPASCTMGTGSFPGVEATGAWG